MARFPGNESGDGDSPARFRKDPDPRFWRMNRSLPFDWQLAPYDILQSQAHARGLVRVGVLTEAEAEEIAAGLDRVQARIEAPGFAFEEADEDIHMAIERLLGEEIGPLAGKLHTGRSRNDQVATDIAMVVGAAFWISPRLMKDRSVWGPPATALGLVPVLLSPWWLPALWTGAGQALFLDAGRLPMTTVGYADLLTGHVGEAGAPWWLGAAVLVAAAAALVPNRTRIPVIVCWIVALAAAVVALVLGHLTFHLPVISTSAGLGFLVLVLQAAFVTAALLGAVGLAASVAAGWRRAIALAVASVFGLVPLLGLGWFVINGPGELRQAQRRCLVPRQRLRRSARLRAPAHRRQVAGLPPDQMRHPRAGCRLDARRVQPRHAVIPPRSQEKSHGHHLGDGRCAMLFYFC